MIYNNSLIKHLFLTAQIIHIHAEIHPHVLGKLKPGVKMLSRVPTLLPERVL
jgi:hypothetical protein